MSDLTIVAYGGGTNSAATLVGMQERGMRPDAVVMADTGDEKPYTYEHRLIVNEWCRKVGFPEIDLLPAGVHPQQLIDGSLLNECMRLGVLPAKAYGFSSCSQKWKIEPQRRFHVKFAAERGVQLEDITVIVGFDADEPSRVERGKANADKMKTKQRFLLFEWDWGRDECVAAIARAGLPQPGKSACFYCPSSKIPEIIALKREYPIHFAKAVAMERRALAGEGQSPALRHKGLGRQFSWEEVGAYDDAQGTLFCEPMPFSDAGTPEVDCGCFDGDV
jgi:hypothetical protein